MKKTLFLILALAALLALCGVSALAEGGATAGTWSELQDALNAGGDVTLTADVTPGEGEEYLTVPSEVDVTLDLNGHIIDRALQAARADNGYVLRVDGTLTLKDTAGGGGITGGWNNTEGKTKKNGSGGGMYVCGTLNMLGGRVYGNTATLGGGLFVRGTVNLAGGEISGNTAEDKGGGVYGWEDCVVNMSGGAIRRNTAKDSGGGIFLTMYSHNTPSCNMTGGSISENSARACGGGVYLNGNMTMSGGEIVGNTANKKAGGLYMVEHLYISGSPRISGNKLNNGSNSNVYLPEELYRNDALYIAFDLTIVDTLTVTEPIGVTIEEDGLVITKGLPGHGSPDQFVSDGGGEIVLNGDGEALLLSGSAAVVRKPEAAVNGWSNWHGEVYQVLDDNTAHLEQVMHQALIYNTAHLELVTPGKAANGVMMYALGEKATPPDMSAFSETIPTAAWPGIYYVWYMAKGDDTHSDSSIERDPVRVEIEPPHEGYLKPAYYAICGETYLLSDLAAELGYDGEINNPRVLWSSKGTRLEQDAEGRWLVRADQSTDLSCIDFNTEEQENYFVFDPYTGKKTDFILYSYPLEEWDCRLVFDPHYEGSEPIVYETAGFITAPLLTREGYRHVGWGLDLYDGVDLDDEEHLLKNVKEFVHPGQRVSPSTLAYYYYAIWKPIEPDPASLPDANRGSGALRLGGITWRQIGRSGGRRLMLAEDVIGEKTYSFDEQASDALFNAFNAGEKAAVIPYAGGSLFQLSPDELGKYLPSLSERTASEAWWLRPLPQSSRYEFTKTYIVTREGYIRDNSYGDRTASLRPSMLLDEAMILMETAAEGGKPAAGGGFGGIAAGDTRKLTLIDPGRAFTASVEGAASIQPGGILGIRYQGAEAGEYVSALLEDAEGNLFYASIETADSSGLWQLALPDSLAEGRYALKVFSEQRNGAADSDCASAPALLRIAVTGKAETEVSITGDLTVVYGDEWTLTAVGMDGAETASLKWASLDPGVVSIDETTGQVRALSVGTAAITVEYESETAVGRASAEITVNPRMLRVVINKTSDMMWAVGAYYPDVSLEGVLEGDVCTIIAPKYELTGKEVWGISDYASRWAMDCAGVYTISLTSADLSNPNYIIPNTSFEFTLKPIPSEIIWGDSVFVYDGQPHCPTARAEYHGEEYFRSYENVFHVDGAATEPGVHTATVVVNEDNYKNHYYAQFYGFEGADLTHPFVILPAGESGRTDAGVTIAGGDRVLGAGNAIALSAEAANPGEGGEWIWSSTDPTVAEVSADGVVTGHRTGIAYISAMWSSDTTCGYAMIRVEVRESHSVAVSVRYDGDGGVPAGAAGSASVDKPIAAVGETVTLTAQPSSSFYHVSEVSAVCGEEPVETTRIDDAHWTFVMPDGDVAAEAVFRSNYIVTFKNHDGETLQYFGMDAGEIPEYDGETPTRPSDDQYDYTFAGWDRPIQPVSEDITYWATYIGALRSYPIHFVDWDGTELRTVTLPYGTWLKYTWEEPHREADEDAVYTFTGWTDADGEVVNLWLDFVRVTGEATYTATYTDLPCMKTGENLVRLPVYDWVEYPFTPVENGNYRFRATGESRHYLIEIHDGEGNLLAESSWLFDCYVTAEAGQSYTVKIKSVDEAAETTVVVDRVSVYAIALDDEIEHGAIVSCPDKAIVGTEVTVVEEPEEGYILKEFRLLDSLGNYMGSFDWSFTMPAEDVIVSAVFEQKNPIMLDGDEHVEMFVVEHEGYEEFDGEMYPTSRSNQDVIVSYEVMDGYGLESVSAYALESGNIVRVYIEQIQEGDWIGQVFRFRMPSGPVILSVRTCEQVMDEPDFILPAAMDRIEEEAFAGAAMRVVYIPDGCGSIGARAFRGCANLTQIRIPAGCSIGSGAFDGCGKVYIFGTVNSAAEAYCDARHPNCIFIPW